ncbi:MAG: AGCS family alanine or glycine:cation symporter [Planctomycetota bacterium]|jgi:AGCS family alanine or glycine:cation symporter
MARSWTFVAVLLLILGSMAPPAAAADPSFASTAAWAISAAPSASAEAEGDSQQNEDQMTSDKTDEELSMFRQFELKVDHVAGTLNEHLGGVMFWDGIGGMPFVLLWLLLGSIFFTIYFGFINFRAFKHAIQVVKGKYDDPNEAGEVTHFQALASALSATVGLGNIGGVAVAVSIGGPGATFWMILAGFLGMSSKFVECTLAIVYRTVDENGKVSGGPMHYLKIGLEKKGMGGLGKVLAVLFAILCVGGSLGGGNTYQIKQSLGAISATVPFLKDNGWVYGIIMAILVGIVIIGGIKRIAQTAEKVVPAMCGLYMLAAIAILVMRFDQIPSAFGSIFSGAFSPIAVAGGFMGVLIQGFKRAAFSNEAGVGSAAIAHSAAKTDEPVREGIVASLGPFIDTVVVCTVTALVIVITGAYNSTDPDMVAARAAGEGAALTSLAFGSVIWWFPYVLSFAVAMFAFSTVISWSYYGERCWTWMFGEASSMSYKILFLVFVFLGSIVSAENVLEFSDLMILGMAFPNVAGVIILAPKVKVMMVDYMKKLKAGEFKTFK